MSRRQKGVRSFREGKGSQACNRGGGRKEQGGRWLSGRKRKTKDIERKGVSRPTEALGIGGGRSVVIDSLTQKRESGHLLIGITPPIKKRKRPAAYAQEK